MFSKKIKSFVGKAKESLQEEVSKVATSYIDLKSNAAPDYSEHAHPPVVELRSLLENLRLKPEKRIFLTVGNINVYFLPTNGVNGKPLNYEGKYELVRADLVRIGDATEEGVASFACEVSKQRIISMLHFHHVIGGKGESQVIIDQAGKHELRFFLADKLFYRYVFDIVETVIDDPYSPLKSIFTLGGDWEDKAFLQVTCDDHEADYPLRFQPLIPYRGIHFNSNRQGLQNFGKADIKCVLKESDGRIIGTVGFEESEGDDIFEDKYVPSFVECSFSIEYLVNMNTSHHFLKVPKVEKGMSDELCLKVQDLKDGDYTIEMEIKNMRNSPDFTKIYSFSLKDGRIMPVPESDRGRHSDPCTFLESGRDFVIIQGSLAR